ncbi:MAG: BamA/TamA family outer membrane protein [Candidatus Babeliales bacterium]
MVARLLPLIACIFLCMHPASLGVQAAGQNTCHINLMHDNYTESIAHWCAEPLFVHRIFFSGTGIDLRELSYLTGLKARTVINPTMLCDAVAYLQKKKRFTAVTFRLEREKDECALFVIVDAYWAVRKIKLSGPLLGINSYAQYYTTNPLEPFCMRQHQDSLLRLTEALREEGFFQAHVYDELKYNDRTRLLDVRLAIMPGIRFVTDAFVFSYSDGSPVLPQRLKEKIERFVRKRLHRKEARSKQVNEVKRALERYLIKKGFTAVHVDMELSFDEAALRVTVQCAITLGKLDKTVSFFGNHYFSQQSLLHYIDSVKPAAISLPPPLMQQALQELYHAHGFWEATVTVQEEKDQYLCVIHERKRAIVKNMIVHGMHASAQEPFFADSFAYLHDHWTYNEEQLQQSKQQLIERYRAHGYWQFALDTITYTRNADGTYTMHIFCLPGERTVIREVTIDGNQQLYLHDLPARLCAQVPLTDPARIQEQKQQLLRYAQEHGYLYATVSYDLELLCDGAARLQWHLQEGEAVFFGKTVLVGATTIPFKKLLSIMAWHEGDAWDGEKITKSLFRLREMGVFETIRIYPDTIEKQEAAKTIIVHVVDDDPVEMRWRVGFQQVNNWNLTFNSASTYKLGSSIVYKNPFNAGDLFSFNADYSRFYRYISGVYNRPWMGGIPLYGIIKGYSNKYTQPIRVGDNRRLYNAIQQGGLVGCSYRWGKSSIGINCGAEVMETSGLSKEVAQAINFEPLLVDKAIPYIFIEPTFFFENLDDKVDPTKGTISMLTSKGLFSWHRGGVNFFKFLFEESIFIPVRNSVFAVHARFGHIFHHSIREIMPPDRFFLGGANSLRGYEPDFAPPLGVIREDDKERVVPQGGRSIINGMVEMRIPVRFGIGVVLFQDFGALLEHSLAEVMGNRLLAVTGFGLRYKTPLGPLRFDIGWKWRRHVKGEARYAWFFTLGHAF